jgi:antirestriction protein ArdC
MNTTTNRSTTKGGRKVYDGPTPEEQLAADLVALMESSELPPWRREWHGHSGNHRNLVTGAEYSGSNPLLLELGSLSRGHSMPLWLGAGQGKPLGWWPKKGSRACRIIRPQLNTYTDQVEMNNVQTGQPEIVDQSRAWVSFKAVAVFNAADLQGATDESQAALDAAIKAALGHGEPAAPAARLEAAESVLEAWEVITSFEGSRACYSPTRDQITMPPADSFINREAFCATWAHEQAHSTGHSSRLSRDMNGDSSSKAYALEELIAELAAVLICYRLQVGSEFTNHAAYLKSWAQILKAEPKQLFKLLSKARAAADLITGATSWEVAA